MEIPLNYHQLEWHEFVNNFHLLEYIETIGKGSYGKVDKYYYKKNKQCVVAKQRIFSNNQKSLTIGLPPDVIREITIQKSLNSPFILPPLAINIDIQKQNYVVYYPYYPYDLSRFLQNLKKPLNEKTIKFILQSLLKGVCYLHQNQFLHRDIKPNNILISNDGVVISDFGMAQQFSIPQLTQDTHFGTIIYRAPEIVNATLTRKIKKENHYLTGVDIWALGCVLYELIFLKHLFYQPSDQRLMEEHLIKLGSEGLKGVYQSNKEYYPNILENQLQEMVYKNAISRQLKDILLMLLEPDQEKRVEATDVLNMSYFRNTESIDNLLTLVE